MEDDSSRWAAVVARDPSADGRFFYAVKTTRIYCRPVCKARLARRANVEFYSDAQDAEAAGFRACKRCKPELATSFTPEADKIAKVCAMLNNFSAHAPLPSLEDMAAEAGLTKFHFHRLFKRETGMTPKEYAKASRAVAQHNAEVGTKTASLASSSLPSPTNVPDMSIPTTPMEFQSLDVAMIVEDTDLFPQIHDDLLLTPMEKDPVLGAQIDDSVIYYTILETTYGRLLVAFQRGQICRLDIGVDDTALIQRLEDSFSATLSLYFPMEFAGPEQVALMRSRIDEVVRGLESSDAFAG